jgi:hypothetical protein
MLQAVKVCSDQHQLLCCYSWWVHAWHAACRHLLFAHLLCYCLSRAVRDAYALRRLLQRRPVAIAGGAMSVFVC